MSMSRGEEGTSSGPGTAVVVKDSQDDVGGNDKSPAVLQPTAASLAPTTEGAGSGGSDENASAFAQRIEQSATPMRAGVENDSKVGGEAGEPAAAEAKSDTAASAVINERNTRDGDSSRALANSSAASPASAAKSDLAPKSEDARVRKTVPNATAARSAKSARQAHQFRGEVDYRSWKSADRAPVWVGPPPVIYGPSPEAKTPYAVDPADGMKRRDWMSSADRSGIWERVVEAPGAVLDGGKQALYGILDSVW
jgi:hypothetical protein